MAPVSFPSPTTKWHSTTYPTLSPTRPEISAKGKTILITGGGTGMGAATAHSFAQAGASRIALLGRREKPLLETKASIHAKFPGIEIFTAPTDVTKKEQVDAAFANFLPGEKTRTLDILVHCAAIIGPQDPIATAPTEAFLAAVHANVSGALHVAQAFTRHATPGASVAIEVNSGAAHMNFVAAFGAYSVAKLAAFRVWDSLGYASKGEGVRVYHVQPGVLDTEMGREGGSPQALGYADDLSLPADFCVWLASPEATFLSGKFLWANWDMDELKARKEEIEGSTLFDIQLGGWPFDQKGRKWEFGGAENGDPEIWGKK